MKWYLTIVWISISLVTINVECFVMCLLVICLYLGYLSVYKLVSGLYITWPWDPYQKHDLQILSGQSVVRPNASQGLTSNMQQRAPQGACDTGWGRVQSHTGSSRTTRQVGDDAFLGTGFEKAPDGLWALQDWKSGRHFSWAMQSWGQGAGSVWAHLPHSLLSLQFSGSCCYCLLKS